MITTVMSYYRELNTKKKQKQDKTLELTEMARKDHSFGTLQTEWTCCDPISVWSGSTRNTTDVGNVGPKSAAGRPLQSLSR